MLESLGNALGTGIYRGWKAGTVNNPNDGKIGLMLAGNEFPSDEMSVGDRSYSCNEKTVAECKAYCCSKPIEIHINPLEIALLSSSTGKPPYSFLEAAGSCHIEVKDTKTKITTPLKLSNDGYCIFSDMPASTDCKIYEGRPLQCRYFPLDFSTEIGRLIQRKGCPGFKKGEKLTREDLAHIIPLGYTHDILERTLFDAELPDTTIAEFERCGKIILDGSGIDPMKTYEVAGFHQTVEKVKGISNMGEQFKNENINQKLFEEFLLKSYNFNQAPQPLSISPLLQV